MLLSNAAEGKMVMCVLLCCSVLQFSSVWIFVVPSFAKFDDQVTQAYIYYECPSKTWYTWKGLVNVPAGGVAALC